MSKSEKKMGKTKVTTAKRAAVGAPVTSSPPAAVRPKKFTARLEWTESRKCHYEVEAVNATELERQVTSLMERIPQIPEHVKNGYGYGYGYKLKLYYTRVDSLAIGDLRRLPGSGGGSHG